MNLSGPGVQMNFLLHSEPLRRALQALCQKQGQSKVLFIGNRREAGCAIPRQGDQLLLLELDDPASGSEGAIALAALEWLQEFGSHRPGLRTVVLSSCQDAESVLVALCSGACGYLVNDPKLSVAARAELIATGMQELARGHAPISPAVVHHLVAVVRQHSSAPGPSLPSSVETSLSKRETEVLQLAAKGFSYAEMAGLLDLSVHTVSTHIRRIYSKFEVNSRGEAIWEASRQGLLRDLVA